MKICNLPWWVLIIGFSNRSSPSFTNLGFYTVPSVRSRISTSLRPIQCKSYQKVYLFPIGFVEKLSIFVSLHCYSSDLFLLANLD